MKCGISVASFLELYSVPIFDALPLTTLLKYQLASCCLQTGLCPDFDDIRFNLFLVATDSDCTTYCNLIAAVYPVKSQWQLCVPSSVTLKKLHFAGCWHGVCVCIFLRF